MSKEQQKWVAIFLVTGGVLYLYFSFLYFPILKQGLELSKAVETKEKELKDAKDKSQNSEILKLQVKDLEKELNFTTKRLPKTEDQAGLIREISRAAAEASLSITSLEFQKSVPGKTFYSEIPVKIVSIGDYHNFGIFLTRLGYSMRLINAGDCQFTSTNASPKGSANIVVVLKAFVTTKDVEGMGSGGKQEAADHPIMPLFRYVNTAGKDPFKSLSTSEMIMVSQEVNIAALRLTGIFSIGRTNVAMFEDTSRLPFYLVGDRLLNKDKAQIKNVEGVIINGVVTLTQTEVISGAVKKVTYEINR
jgi:type IV pilus assembly protein PilO